MCICSTGFRHTQKLSLRTIASKPGANIPMFQLQLYTTTKYYDYNYLCNTSTHPFRSIATSSSFWGGLASRGRHNDDDDASEWIGRPANARNDDAGIVSSSRTTGKQEPYRRSGESTSLPNTSSYPPILSAYCVFLLLLAMACSCIGRCAKGKSML